MVTIDVADLHSGGAGVNLSVMEVEQTGRQQIREASLVIPATSSHVLIISFVCLDPFGFTKVIK